MSRQFSIAIRGSKSKPKDYMSGVTDQYTPEQVKQSTSNQALPSITAQVPSLFIDLCHDQKTWDTIIVCSLLSEPFGIPMSNAEIAQAINIRDKRKDSPIDADTVDDMFKGAKLPSVQILYPETCRYRKWEAVRNKPPAAIWLGNGEDTEVREAFTLWSETLRILKPDSFPKQGFSVLGPQRQP